jgi:hypothetical protein
MSRLSAGASLKSGGDGACSEAREKMKTSYFENRRPILCIEKYELFLNLQIRQLNFKRLGEEQQKQQAAAAVHRTR